MKRQGPFRVGRTFLFRLEKGSDLLEGLASFCVGHKVRCATISLIGAVTEARIGYYEQVKRVYVQKTLRGELEILHCVGNLSLKDGKPFPHLHISLGDTRFRMWGGHLFPGSKVFAAEVCVTELRGPARVRGLDPETGLSLWPL